MATKLSSFTTNFASSYKYKIAGKHDFLFSNVGGFIKNDIGFSLFKAKRLNEVTTINRINANPDLTDNQKLLQTSERKALFVGDAYRTLKNAVTKEDSAKRITAAMAQIVKELHTSVMGYIEARGGSTGATYGEDGSVIVDISEEGAAASGYDPSQDQKFLDNLSSMMRGLKSLLLKQKGPLRVEGQFFNINYYVADKRLGEIEAAVASFTAPAAATAATPPEDTSGASADTGTGTGEDTAAPPATPPQESLDITV